MIVVTEFSSSSCNLRYREGDMKSNFMKVRGDKGYKCEVCKLEYRSLHMHHIKPIFVFVRERLGSITQTQYENLPEVVKTSLSIDLFDKDTHMCYEIETNRPWDTEDNLQLLCADCHADIHPWMPKPGDREKRKNYAFPQSKQEVPLLEVLLGGGGKVKLNPDIYDTLYSKLSSKFGPKNLEKYPSTGEVVWKADLRRGPARKLKEQGLIIIPPKGSKDLGWWSLTPKGYEYLALRKIGKELLEVLVRMKSQDIYTFSFVRNVDLIERYFYLKCVIFREKSYLENMLTNEEFSKYVSEMSTRIFMHSVTKKVSKLEKELSDITRMISEL